jgi:triphosphoribosyl-dephospho-CoA synthase
LSVESDSLVCAKFGEEKAKEVSIRAKHALDDKTLHSAMKLDRELLKEDINPGSTADLVAASLFISLLKGLRF